MQILIILEILIWLVKDLYYLYYLRCQCSALPTELSKPHESGRIWVSPLYGDVLDRSHVALIAQLGEYCTGIAEVVGSNPAQSLKIF